MQELLLYLLSVKFHKSFRVLSISRVRLQVLWKRKPFLERHLLTGLRSKSKIPDGLCLALFSMRILALNCQRIVTEKSWRIQGKQKIFQLRLSTIVSTIVSVENEWRWRQRRGCRQDMGTSRSSIRYTCFVSSSTVFYLKK